MYYVFNMDQKLVATFMLQQEAKKCAEALNGWYGARFDLKRDELKQVEDMEAAYIAYKEQL